MGIILTTVVIAYLLIGIFVVKLMPNVWEKVVAAALFVLVPFGDQLVGLAYFKYLCYRDAGQFVSRSVDNVAGFYQKGTPFPEYIEVHGFDYVEGLGKHTRDGRQLLRLERDSESSAIRTRQVPQLESRYSFDTDVKHVSSAFIGYFSYTYHAQVISDMATGDQLAKQMRIFYPGGWLARYVFRSGGATCAGNSINVSRFLASVLHPIHQGMQKQESAL